MTIGLVGMEQDGKTIFDQRDELTFVLGEGGDLSIPIGVELALEKIKKNEKVSILTGSLKYTSPSSKPRFLKLFFIRGRILLTYVHFVYRRISQCHLLMDLVALAAHNLAFLE